MMMLDKTGVDGNNVVMPRSQSTNLQHRHHKNDFLSVSRDSSTGENGGGDRGLEK